MEETFKKGDPVIIVQDFNSGSLSYRDGGFALFKSYDLEKNTRSAGYTCQVDHYYKDYDTVTTGVVVYKIRAALPHEIPDKFKGKETIINSYQIY